MLVKTAPTVNRLATSCIKSPRSTQRKMRQSSLSASRISSLSPRNRPAHVARQQSDLRRVRFPSCDSRLVREHVAPMSPADVSARHTREESSNFSSNESMEQSLLTHCLSVFMNSSNESNENRSMSGAAHAAANRRDRRRAQQQRRMTSCSRLVRVVSSAEIGSTSTTASSTVLPLDLLVSTGPLHNNFNNKHEGLSINTTAGLRNEEEEEEEAKCGSPNVEEWRYGYYTQKAGMENKSVPATSGDNYILA